MRADVLRRCGSAAILLSLGLGLPPAFAQSTTAERPWTDPPARTAPSSPPSQAANPQPAPPQQAASRDQKARTRVAVTPRRSRLAETRSETRIRRTIAERPLAIRPSATRPVATRIARQPAYAQRAPVGRFEDFEVDERSRRIRAAEEAGFLVVRSRTVEFPDGRRMRTYIPYEEPDDFDD